MLESTVSTFSLWLPILLTTAALFFSGFVCWMIIPLHKADWQKLPNESEFLDKMAEMKLPSGNFMVPHAPDAEATKSAEYKKALENNTFGAIQVWNGPPNMGANLGCQVGYLLVVNFCLAYLATLALPIDAGFTPVFRFISTAAFLTFTAAIVPHAIWFKNRIVGHVIEGVIQASIAGAIFAWLWPTGPTL